MNITNGTVEIERVLRPADFESKRVKVALSFAIDEAEEAAHVIEHVGQMAHDKLMGMLHRVESRLYGTSPAAAALPEVKAENAAKAEKLAAGPTLGAVATAVSAPTTTTTTPSGSDTSNVAAGNPPASPEPAPAITDAQVLASIQAVAGRFQGSYDPDMVKKVIWKHAGAVGASYTTIPATDPRRQALLDELNAMKPAPAAPQQAQGPVQLAY